MARMRLNSIKPGPGSRTARRRVGRGIGSGLGKTAGRGHKGQHARAGGYHKVGFEGGQMPLHRRLPKRGFTSPTRDQIAEVRTSELEHMKASEIDLAVLRAERVISRRVPDVKVILSGALSRKITLKGVRVSKGARAAIEAAGGSVEAPKSKTPKTDARKTDARKTEASKTDAPKAD